MILNHAVEGAGRSVLLLHPVGIDLSFLAPLAALLAKHYRVMRMDLRGHGGSPLMPLAHDLGDFADDVHDTLAHSGFGPCAVVGFSFGGMVAQTLALRHAADVSALIPCAGPCTQTPEGRIVAASRGTDALERGMGVVLEAAMDRWFTPAFRASGGADAAEKYLRERDPCGWAQGWKAIAAIDTLPHLPQVCVPTLCIAGELDKSSPPEKVKMIADAVPGAQFRVVAGAPHMLFIEQPEAVAQEIIAFLGD
jgi:3-oxoadipate enol-lactonase